MKTSGKIAVIPGPGAPGLLCSQARHFSGIPLPTNVASMKSMVADSSIQVRWGGWRAAAGTSVRHVLNECSTAPWRPPTNISSRLEELPVSRAIISQGSR
jgi:hypothetical protein